MWLRSGCGQAFQPSQTGPIIGHIMGPIIGLIIDPISGLIMGHIMGPIIGPIIVLIIGPLISLITGLLLEVGLICSYCWRACHITWWRSASLARLLNCSSILSVQD